MTIVPAPDRRAEIDLPRMETPTELVVALHAFRREPFTSEQALAETWTRATLQRRDEDFEIVGLAVVAWGEFLRRRGERPFARGGLLDTMGSDSAGLTGAALREGRTELFQDIADFLARRGVSLPPLEAGRHTHPVWHHVIQVVEGYRALWLDPHLRLGGDVDVVERAALAGHALCAPDDKWPGLDYITDPAGHRAAALRYPQFLEPNGLIEEMVRVRFEQTARIGEARKAKADLGAFEMRLRHDLEAHRLSSDSASRLEAAGVDTTYLRELVAHQERFDQGGLWKRLAHGSVENELHHECEQVVERWSAVVAEAGRRVDQAVADGDRELAPLLEAAERFARDDPGPPYFALSRPNGYRGAETVAALRERGLSPRGHTRRWDVEPLPDRRDVRVPEVDSTMRSALFLPGRTDLTYQDACAGVRTMVLERLAKATPRSVTLTWIDPVQQGLSAGPVLELLEIDKKLLGDAVWSEPDDIARVLRGVTDRMAYLNQRCLRGAYDDLDAYNAEAGTLAEPHHVVVVTGFPHKFTEDAVSRILTILESGAHLGVSLLVVADEYYRRHVVTSPGPAGYLSVEFRRIVDGPSNVWPGWDRFLDHDIVIGDSGSPWVVVSAPVGSVFARCSWREPDDRTARLVVQGYGNASVEAEDVVVDSGHLVADEPGDRSSAAALDVPVGVRGRGTQVPLRLGQGLAQNVLVGGLPGSGKSSLFHTLITNAVRRYSPDELELYLLDFKQGVEFQPYASRGLPHARVVAVQSEREFGLSVLRGIRAEIDRRAEVFRGPSGAGSDSLREYRERTGETMPRVLVVVDEFQVMFAEDDAVAHECVALLDQVVRQGRAFGIHTVLGTQTLRGGTLGQLRGTLDQIAVRVLLKSSDADARLFLGDDNPAGAALTRPGQAILNADGGSREGNVEFQVALTSDEARDAAIDEARRHADARGDRRRPFIFDGTRRVDIREDPHVHALTTGRIARDPRVLRVHLGLSVAIGGSGGVELRRDAAAHLLIVERDVDVAAGALTSGLVTAALSVPTPPRVVAVDGIGIDEDQGELLPRVLRHLPDAVCQRRRRLTHEVEALVAEVRRRHEQDDYAAPRVLLVLQALQRLRELSDDRPDDGGPSLQEQLFVILRDGSDVGVHVLATVDSAENLERRLGYAALGEFGARLVGQCSADASHRLVGSAAASRLRQGALVLHQPDLDRTEKVRTFPVPDQQWIAGVLGGAR
jgi:hypothetical protein